MIRLLFMVSAFSTTLLINNEAIDSSIYFRSTLVEPFNAEIRNDSTEIKNLVKFSSKSVKASSMEAANSFQDPPATKSKSKAEDSEQLVVNKLLTNNDTASPGNLLVSRFDHKKWEEQKRLSNKIHIACILFLVVIVVTGTSALIYIIRVTLLAREMFKSREVTNRFQPTADNMRTVDEVIDQFKTSFRASVSKQAQPLKLSTIHQ